MHTATPSRKARLCPRSDPGPLCCPARFPAAGIDDILIGNGVSELVTLTLQALLEPGDEVLIPPSPDYPPLWTASTVLAGGVPRHYPCDETAGWLPTQRNWDAW